MRKTVFIVFLASMMTLFVGTGCTDKKTASSDSVGDTLVDTLGQDSAESIIESEPVPKAADELFDDFIFNYAANRKLQRERTDFPVKLNSYGKESEIEKNNWPMEHFFMRQGYYTLVFTNAKQMNVVKDTTVSTAYIEKVNFAKKQVKRWQFNRVDGLWRMQGVKIMALSQHEDASFLRLYEAFATDSATQMRSLAESVKFSGPDPEDDFSRMNGEIMPEQWPMFMPWMPHGVLYNIHYGAGANKASNTRIFIIRGIANGLETELTFVRRGNSWMLTKLNT